MLRITINKQSNGHSMNVSTHAMSMAKYLLQTLSLFCLLSTMALANTKAEQANPKPEALTNAIIGVQYSSLPGNRLQISLELSEQAVTPLSFTIDNPARIAFDFVNTGSKLPKRSQPIGIGIAQSITTISTKTKTRVILNLTEVVPYQVTTQGKNVLITLDSESTGTALLKQATQVLRQLRQTHLASLTSHAVSKTLISDAAKKAKAASSSS